MYDDIKKNQKFCMQRMRNLAIFIGLVIWTNGFNFLGYLYMEFSNTTQPIGCMLNWVIRIM